MLTNEEGDASMSFTTVSKDGDRKSENLRLFDWPKGFVNDS